MYMYMDIRSIKIENERETAYRMNYALRRRGLARSGEANGPTWPTNVVRSFCVCDDSHNTPRQAGPLVNNFSGDIACAAGTPALTTTYFGFIPFFFIGLIMRRNFYTETEFRTDQYYIVSGGMRRTNVFVRSVTAYRILVENR